ncbi:MAG: hypothetical protein HYY93_01615 [Planctomycetes bacterium]|nr:hypothetical protein [Planctomycetota bacterium]
MIAGILALLVLVGMVLLAIIGVAIFWYRRARAIEAAQAAQKGRSAASEWGRLPESFEVHSDWESNADGSDTDAGRLSRP